MTFVKICGLTNVADALAALDAGADYVGFIFHEKSPRYVTPDQVVKIVSELPHDRRARTVGVFVDAPLETIYAIRTQCSLDLIQLHGAESPLTVKAVGNAYKAIRPSTLAEWQQAAKLYLPLKQKETRYNGVPDLLIDAYHPTQHGGTGLSVNREIALAARAATDRLMLAGGLTPDNVAEAVHIVQPFAVDVSSGVESTPGKKDHSKIQVFIETVRKTSEVSKP